jgi:hypothetical protein
MAARPTPSSDLAAQFPGLVGLCGYVSNAWDYEYGSPEAAVVAFIGECADQRASAAAGLEELLRKLDPETERKAVLGWLGFGYTGPPGTVDRFLRWTQARLRQQHD